jgi:hypothetical protein
MEKVREDNAKIAASHRHKGGELLKNIKDLREGHVALNQQLAAERKSRHACDKALSQQEADDQERKARRMDRMAKKCKQNIVTAMHEAVYPTHGGAHVLKKINAAGKKKELRRVVVSDEKMQLQWGKPNAKKMQSYVNLSEVGLIGYGFASRACWGRFQGEHLPWLCFSLYTAERSYDFVCTSEGQTQMFVVALSRLCSRLCGWPLPGSFANAGQFHLASGWCKIMERCRGQRRTLCAVVLNAARLARDRNGYSPRSGNPSSPASSSKAHQAKTHHAGTGGAQQFRLPAPPVATASTGIAGSSTGDMLTGLEGGSSASARSPSFSAPGEEASSHHGTDVGAYDPLVIPSAQHLPVVRGGDIQHVLP